MPTCNETEPPARNGSVAPVRGGSRCASAALLERQAPALRDFLHRLGREARQAAVGLVIDRDYLEIAFPLAPVPPARPQRQEGE